MQMKYLDEWSFLERDCAHSLSGTTQALNATVLRLPVSDGAMVGLSFFTTLLPVEILIKTSYLQADIQGIENALRSAVDVMHTLGNSITARLPQVLIFYKSPLCGFLASYNIYWFTQCYRNKSCDVALSTEPCKRLLFLVWNHLPFFAVSPDECLGISALQSFRSRTHSDSTVQRLAVHTSIDTRKGYIQTDRFGFHLPELLLF